MTLDNIPFFLKWGYYVTPMAYTQRSLLTFDLPCCHLIVDCPEAADLYVQWSARRNASIIANATQFPNGKMICGAFGAVSS